MADLRLGLNLWSQASDWPSFLAAARRAETLGFDHVWTWDHVLAIFGDPDQPIFEGYTALAASPRRPSGSGSGLFVGANTFRNPGLAVKALTTIDHISGGRAIMGMGGAWFGDEHRAFGLDFGSGFGAAPRLAGRGADATRTLLDGGEVTSQPGGRYAFDHLRIEPDPSRPSADHDRRGGGEEDAPDRRPARRHVERVRDARDARRQGRDPAGALRRRRARPEAIERSVGCKITIRSTAAEADRAMHAWLEHNRTPPERIDGDASVWTGTAEQIADTMLAYRRVGFDTFIVELPAPYDVETMESLMTVVKPMVTREAR